MTMHVTTHDMTIYRAYLAAIQVAQHTLITHTLERETGRACDYYRASVKRELAELAGLLGFTLTPVEAPAPAAEAQPDAADFNDDIVDATAA